MSDYKSGYGQCKADLLILINEALVLASEAVQDARVWAQDANEAKKNLQHRIKALRQVRSYIMTLKGPGDNNIIK